MRVSLDERFWSKVEVGYENECWPFTGALNGDGYGSFRFNGRIEKSHRMAWFLSHDTWPTLHVLHRCDNTRCQNPAHLFEGTPRDNTYDCIEKGRFNPNGKYGPGKPKLRAVIRRKSTACGEWTSMAKLLPVDVLAIRARCESGEKQTVVARDYSIDKSAVSNIVRRRNWAHI